MECSALDAKNSQVYLGDRACAEWGLTVDMQSAIRMSAHPSTATPLLRVPCAASGFLTVLLCARAQADLVTSF
ncbi:hypothetical protein EXIGLDRAFT_724190 [Exidia glandulosa HHB12029]|uniref:Uncharacterized protein n=1 Tax=Exidia glandulosa HHB12029 TaxID=1314781 RepID=A0A165EHZ2_EXIGL|nr:hypothetical protein EXIGLDRAFT_724190 [Exidia glandulosa HHB12029]